MKTTKKNFDSKKKLLTASTSLLISAAMLGTSTYAWFTMNKEVKVQGMQMKAHAEEGLLINEVKAWNDSFWDDLALAGDSGDATALRPASTKNLQDWWHANSKSASNEAGASGATGSTVDSDTVDGAYTNISSISEETTNTGGNHGVAAEKTVYYKQATFGSGGTAGSSYENGEGFYVKYTYYLKSSKTDSALTVSTGKLNATVTASKIGGGSGAELERALRVGIQVGSDSDNFKIFAPVSGATASYSVAGGTSGTTYETVTPATAKAAINPHSAVDIPKVDTDGIPVCVYVWFEGEDQNCKSANLDVINSYQIDVTFEDADLV